MKTKRTRRLFLEKKLLFSKITRETKRGQKWEGRWVGVEERKESFFEDIAGMKGD